MSTIAIVLIAVGVIALLAILFFATSKSRREEKRLRAERERAATHHREVASERHSHASVAEQKAEEARLKAERAQQEAEFARREASVHEGRADLHEQGELDHELRTDGTAEQAHESHETHRAEHVSGGRTESVQDSNGRYTTDAPQTPPPPTRR